MKVFYAYVNVSSRHQESSLNLQKIRDELIKNIRDKGDEVILYAPEVYQDKNEEMNHSSLDILNVLKGVDVFIGEMSGPSQTMGFLLAYSLQHGKPSLYFYPEDTSGKPAGPLFNNPSRLLSVRSFTDTNYGQIVSRFLRKAQKQLRSDRTTFVTTRYINDFLNWKTRKTGLSKGEVIRGILETAIEDDSEYLKK